VCVSFCFQGDKKNVLKCVQLLKYVFTDVVREGLLLGMVLSDFGDLK